MKIMKKLTAVILAAVMALCVVGCHKKDEVAVKIGDFEFTSAYYMCALVYADSDARTKIDKQLAEAKKDDDKAQTEEIDYYKQKIDKMDFSKYVKKEALKSLKRVAAYKTKCKKDKVDIEDSVASMAEQYATYYWSSYGYSQMLEPNGVSESTFKEYLKDTYYSSVYFEHLYGEGGEREIEKDKVKAKMDENYVIADMINVDFTDQDSDLDKQTKKEKLDSYANAITAGTMTFKDAYNDYNGITEDAAEDASQVTTDPELEVEEGSTPKDSNAQILGSSDTSSASEYFDTVKAMAIGEAKVVTAEDGCIALIVKQDIDADPYYLKSLDMASRQLITGKDLEKEIEKFGETLKFKEYTKATKQFKPSKIVYPDNGAAAAGATAVQ